MVDDFKVCAYALEEVEFDAERDEKLACGSVPKSERPPL